MSVPEGYNASFAELSTELGTLSHPDIRAHHDACIASSLSGDFADEIAYEQGVLTVLHRFDEARMEQRNEHDRAVTFAGIALCLADIHYQTGHYTYCADELAFLRRISTNELHAFATAALKAVSTLTDTVSQHDHAVVRTEISLY